MCIGLFSTLIVKKSSMQIKMPILERNFENMVGLEILMLNSTGKIDSDNIFQKNYTLFL